MGVRRGLAVCCLLSVGAGAVADHLLLYLFGVIWSWLCEAANRRTGRVLFLKTSEEDEMRVRLVLEINP